MSEQDVLVVPTRRIAPPSPTLTVRIPYELNDYEQPMRWMICWLLANGEEGTIARMGRGEADVRLDVPHEAIGYRLRRWTSDGVAPEYEDTLFA